MNFELVRTQTADHLLHQGLLSPGNLQKPIVLHLHGYTGNMYQNIFIPTMAQTLAQQQMGFLTVQTRGSYSRFECYTDDGGEKTYGSLYERLEEAYLDIDAWVHFLKEQGYQHIMLQGHSLGTHKIVRYLFEGTYQKDIQKLLLLCPFDNTFYTDEKTRAKHLINLKEAQTKIAAGRGMDLCPFLPEDLSLSYQSFSSWGRDDDFGCLFDFYRAAEGYDFPILRQISIPTKMIVGTQDEFLLHPPQAASIMKQHIKHFKKALIENANHTFLGYEQELADEILKFIA